MTHFKEVKVRFRFCMRHLFEHAGDSFARQDMQSQLRDMTRIFMMGWMESMIANDVAIPDDVDDQFCQDVELTTDPNWWPDKSWHWW